MLIKNQRITVDFDSKEPVKITDFKYKEGEIDKNGIVVDCLGVALKPDVGVLAYWLYSTQDEYIFVPVAGERKDETTLLVRPPQSVLIQGEVGLEIILTSDEDGVMKSPSIFIGVEKALVVDEEASEEDENLSVILQLINQVGDLHQAAIELNADMAAADAVYKANEQARQTSFSKIQSDASTVISSANTAASNANTKATLADQKAALANTAATNANTAKTNADTAASNANAKATLANDKAALANTAANTANTAATAANTAKTNADTAANNANAKATLANDKAALANTAATNANNAASVANGITAEVADARTDYNGVEYANLKTRLDNDFETLASLIPTDIAFNGYESVTTNDTLSGEVSSAVLSGNTMVNEIDTKNTSLNYSQNMLFSYSNGEIQLSFVANTYPSFGSSAVRNLKSNTTYTVVFDFKGEVVEGRSYRTGITRRSGSSAWNTNAYAFVPNTSYTTHVFKTTTGELTPEIEHYGFAFSTRLSNGTGLTDKIWFKNILILEGDHTDKPLEFFEGLKSSEVSEVTSHGVNLVDNSKNLFGTGMNDGGVIGTTGAHANRTLTDFISVSDTKTYTTYGSVGTFFNFYDDNKTCINPTRVNVANNLPFSIPSGSKFARFFIGDPKSTTMYLYEATGSEPSTYVPYQESKTTFEPIILRSLPNGVADTYDVDTQTLTRRCGEVVLDGSESAITMHASNETFIRFYITLDIFKNIPVGSGGYLCSDRYVYGNTDLTVEAMSLGGSPLSNGNLFIVIAKSKLATPDVAGFKAWLAQNPTTVVYQLAESTTEYIENNGQLRSYEAQTTVTADSIVPVKLNGNIPVNYASTLNTLSTVARELKLENTALIEQAETLEQQLLVANETNDYQDSLIDVSLLATDELYTLIEPLLPEFSTLNTKGGNAMVDAYVAMVIKGLKTIDQVPSRYREEVKRVLAELEK